MVRFEDMGVNIKGFSGERKKVCPEIIQAAASHCNEPMPAFWQHQFPLTINSGR